jgi:predicted O-methyltransferase YrrM
MDQGLERLLTEYEERSRREWQGILEPTAANMAEGRDRMLLFVGRESGQFLNSLARASGAQLIVELGTSYGYSTLWLADAARATGGKVISLDVADYKQDYARQALARVGLDDVVEFRTGDALELIPALPDGVDFVLVDIWKEIYVPSLELIFPKLKPGAALIADNMLQPAFERPHANAYRKAVRAKPGISSVLLEIGSGLEVSRLAGPLDEGL